MNTLLKRQPLLLNIPIKVLKPHSHQIRSMISGHHSPTQLIKAYSRILSIIVYPITHLHSLHIENSKAVTLHTQPHKPIHHTHHLINQMMKCMNLHHGLELVDGATQHHINPV
jgi:hypothetical protein